MKVDSIFLCDYVTIDKANKLSLIGIFEKITLPKKLKAIPKLFIVVHFHGEKSETGLFVVNVEIVGENKINIVKNLPDIELQADKQIEKGRVIVELNNLKFEDEGEYIIKILINGKEIGNSKVNVNFRE